MIATDLLEILCCPESQQRLRPAEPALVAAINERIRCGVQKNRAGAVVKEPIDEALMRSDGKFLYPIRKNLPIMLVDEAIPRSE